MNRTITATAVALGAFGALTLTGPAMAYAPTDIAVTPSLPTVDVRECYNEGEEPFVILPPAVEGIAYTVIDIDAPYGDKTVRAVADFGYVFSTKAGWFAEADGSITTVVDLGERTPCVVEAPVVVPPVESPAVKPPVVPATGIGAPDGPIYAEPVAESATVAVVADAPQLASTGPVTGMLAPIAAALTVLGAALVRVRRMVTRA